MSACNKEPPPRLLDATTILLGNVGYIQVGYLPEMDDSNNTILNVRVIIVLDGTYIPFDSDELANFFMSIRDDEEFNDLEGCEEYLPSVKNDFIGNFFFAKNADSSYFTTYVNYSSEIKYEIVFPNKEMVLHILSLERTISAHMNWMDTLDDKKSDLLHQLDVAAARCLTSPAHLHMLAENTPDKLIIELSKNLFSFFTKYWYAKRSN